MRLTRGQKIIRNMLLCLLLWGLVYAMLGFPPYTVRGMLDRMERQCFLSDLELLVVHKEPSIYQYKPFNRHLTYLIARSGDTYVSTVYCRQGLEVELDYHWEPNKVSRDALCTAWNGTLYVAGEFTEAASAVAEVTAQRTSRTYDPDTEEYELDLGEKKRFSYSGEKINEAVFAFCYRDGDVGPAYWPPEDGTGLEEVSYEWYSGYTKGYGGRGILHVDLPVVVTLYGADGSVLDTLELSIDNYELHSWYYT